MIIIRINGVFGYASTGRTIREIAEFTTILGHSDFTFISEGISTPPYSERYISDAERNIHAILSRITACSSGQMLPIHPPPDITKISSCLMNLVSFFR